MWRSARTKFNHLCYSFKVPTGTKAVHLRELLTFITLQMMQTWNIHQTCLYHPHVCLPRLTAICGELPERVHVFLYGRATKKLWFLYVAARHFIGTPAHFRQAITTRSIVGSPLKNVLHWVSGRAHKMYPNRRQFTVLTQNWKLLMQYNLQAGQELTSPLVIAGRRVCQKGGLICYCMLHALSNLLCDPPRPHHLLWS